MDNPLLELQRHGQSVWYDNIRRGLLASGGLATLIADGVTGVTSNPTIFEKAISGSRDYDESLSALVEEGKAVREIFEEMAVEDIRAAADLLGPTYDRTEGRDGFVSLEVSPTLAHDASGTIEEAHRFVRTVGRPNLMIKVPATRAGVQAIEALIGPDTVNTLPPATLAAFRDHGDVRATLEEDVPKADAVLRQLAVVGIDLAEVTRELEEEGVKAFAASFDDLFRCIAAKRDLLTSGLLERQTAVLHEAEESLEQALSDLEKRQAAARIWARDPKGRG